MTYYNILYSPGLGQLPGDANGAGVDGLIVPDLPLDETADYSGSPGNRGSTPSCWPPPTTSDVRMQALVKHSSGFLYLVSLLGVTGARSQLGDDTVKLVRFAKRQTRGKIPLGVGFGISKPEHVRAIVDAGADGVIVGSSIVNMVASDKPRGAMLREIEIYVRSLKTATKPRQASQTLPRA